ncbi:MAG: AAA family ATPase [Chloroflexi bacterium]|nr:AAA family ATPase [Chloroflexota bacterium]
MTTIAIAGKGGTGKTTVAGLLIKYLRDKNEGSVLAIDADPSANLNAVLGLPLESTVGDIREETLARVGSGSMQAGVAKQDYLDYRINEALVEGPGVDLLAMGRPEGPGCYCAANNMLRVIIDRLAKSYSYVVIDNEAGLEHLSRRTTRDVDVLLIVSDPTLRGITAAGRVVEVINELKTKVGRHYLVINRADGELPRAISEAIARYGLNLIGSVPVDDAVAAFDAVGKPTVDLPPEAPAYRAVRVIAEKVFNGSL